MFPQSLQVLQIWRKLRQNKSKAKNEKERAGELRRRVREANKKLMQPETSGKGNTEKPHSESDSPEEDPFEDDSENHTAFLYCNSLFSRSKIKEKWIRCEECGKWAHCEYADVSMKCKTFIYDVCR
ncbi:hypothetical protein QE152_g12825 [Popillia japonica]|uniref:Uncharacterized protein n=1 Tax=Popillia japonica TaxID=7064 RepID=A0AAW1LDT6_POPJA